jgi:hypothetical protein
MYLGAVVVGIHVLILVAGIIAVSNPAGIGGVVELTYSPTLPTPTPTNFPTGPSQSPTKFPTTKTPLKIHLKTQPGSRTIIHAKVHQRRRLEIFKKIGKRGKMEDCWQQIIMVMYGPVPLTIMPLLLFYTGMIITGQPLVFPLLSLPHLEFKIPYKPWQSHQATKFIFQNTH